MILAYETRVVGRLAQSSMGLLPIVPILLQLGGAGAQAEIDDLDGGFRRAVAEGPAMRGVERILEIPGQRHFEFVRLTAIAHVETGLAGECGGLCAFGDQLAAGAGNQWLRSCSQPRI